MYLEFRFRRFVQLRQFRFLPPSLTIDFGFDFLVLDGVVFDGVVFDGVVFDGVVFDGVVFDGDVFDGVVFDGSSRALLLWTKAIGSRALAAAFFNTAGLTKGVVLSNCACL